MMISEFCLIKQALRKYTFRNSYFPYLWGKRKVEGTKPHWDFPTLISIHYVVCAD